ncbi:MAG: protein kinase [Acidobacteria bacterium]|nr:protein kinase [Acidobacteriota bacterium]
MLGKVIADKYRVESLLRESESGDLYKGHHEVMDKPVTIRVLPPAVAIDARWSKSFLDGAKAASAVRDDNILNINDFGSGAKGLAYAVYEPTDGRTLIDLESGEGSIDQEKAVALAVQIGRACAAAHEKGVIHGNLAPENVFLEENDAVKVFGFGADPLTVPRDADPRYLAPEQLSKFPAGTERSDIYSLGVILFELLSGVVPFDGSTSADVLAKINAEPPPPLSAFRRDLHPELEPIILTALAVDPDKRYQSMASFAEDLELVLGTPVKAAAAAAGERKHNIWQTAFIVLAGIVLLGGALIYATQTRSKPAVVAEADAQSLPVQPIGPATGAQEEALAKLPDMTEAEMLAAGQSNTALPADTLPGGDGYNAWGNGGAPPTGAPAQNVGPGGQSISGDPNGASPFMPSLDIPPGCSMLPSGVVLCPQPLNPNGTLKPTPTPKTSANANAAVPSANANASKPMATPIPKKPADTTKQPANKKNANTPEDLN